MCTRSTETLSRENHVLLYLLITLPVWFFAMLRNRFVEYKEQKKDKWRNGNIGEDAMLSCVFALGWPITVPLYFGYLSIIKLPDRLARWYASEAKE